MHGEDETFDRRRGLHWVKVLDNNALHDGKLKVV